MALNKNNSIIQELFSKNKAKYYICFVKIFLHYKFNMQSFIKEK